MSEVIEPPFFPIIYVRGYAGSAGEVEDTVATPYMGFNDGSTKLRQSWTGEIVRHIFESPLLRLMKDYGYADIYSEGQEITASELPPRSVVIFRYYERASVDLGAGRREEIEVYARELGALVHSLRDRICGDDAAHRNAFRVYLVAHSMGGLICRCLLQNPGIDMAAAKLVDKVFTYATPHNGIDLALFSNVPGGLFTTNNSDTFNRTRMREYLALPPATEESDRVDRLHGMFPPERFFCLVGTNDRDYTVGGGVVKRIVGEMSDGLVRIANATVDGAPRAMVHRSHSGHYGIVNSEEGYQNLRRFLFGDVRVEGVLRVQELCLPPKIEREHREGKKVRASYHFEASVRVRGARYDLHRRLVNEGSAVFRRFDELFKPRELGLTGGRHPHLFTTFLSTGAKVNPRRRTLGFSVEIRVLVPEYTVDGLLFLKDHYEGSSLFRDTVTIEVTPPDTADATWSVAYGFDSSTPGRTTRDAAADPPDATKASRVFRIPLESGTKPGLTGELELELSPWNS